MLPTVLLTAEEAIRMVPARMKEAAIGMGATQAQLLWRIVLPTAMPGILTGVMLAVARAAGETAPLLFTALFSNYWLVDRGHSTSCGRPRRWPCSSTTSRPCRSPTRCSWRGRPRSCSSCMVLGFNIAGQFLSRNRHRR